MITAISRIVQKLRENKLLTFRFFLGISIWTLGLLAVGAFVQTYSALIALAAVILAVAIETVIQYVFPEATLNPTRDAKTAEPISVPSDGQAIKFTVPESGGQYEQEEIEVDAEQIPEEGTRILLEEETDSTVVLAFPDERNVMDADELREVTPTHPITIQQENDDGVITITDGTTSETIQLDEVFEDHDVFGYDFLLHQKTPTVQRRLPDVIYGGIRGDNQ